MSNQSDALHCCAGVGGSRIFQLTPHNDIEILRLYAELGSTPTLYYPFRVVTKYVSSFTNTFFFVLISPDLQAYNRTYYIHIASSSWHTSWVTIDILRSTLWEASDRTGEIISIYYCWVAPNLRHIVERLIWINTSHAFTHNGWLLHNNIYIYITSILRQQEIIGERDYKRAVSITGWGCCRGCECVWESLCGCRSFDLGAALRISARRLFF